MRKTVLLLLAGLVLLLAMSGVAVAAASPSDIYNDWKDHGTLTQTYSEAELRAYLNDPTIHVYGDSSTLTPLDSYVNNLLNKSGRSTFPWTGAQIAAMAVAAALLITLGVLLRRSSRQKRHDGE